MVTLQVSVQRIFLIKEKVDQLDNHTGKKQILVPTYTYHMHTHKIISR